MFKKWATLITLLLAAFGVVTLYKSYVEKEARKSLNNMNFSSGMVGPGSFAGGFRGMRPMSGTRMWNMNPFGTKYGSCDMSSFQKDMTDFSEDQDKSDK